MNSRGQFSTRQFIWWENRRQRETVTAASGTIYNMIFKEKKFNWPADEGSQFYQPEAQSFLHDLEPKEKQHKHQTSYTANLFGTMIVTTPTVESI